MFITIRPSNYITLPCRLSMQFVFEFLWLIPLEKVIMDYNIVRISCRGVMKYTTFGGSVVKKRRVRFTLVDPPCGTIGVLLSNTILSDSPLPGGSKDRENVRLISEQMNFSFTRLIISPNANKVSNPKTQRRETSFPKAKEINNGSRLFIK